ncbi:MAG TPA: hypothetical protein VIH99_01175 [Bdellovibrionota bacterium]|jgi:hypothetical protein
MRFLLLLLTAFCPDALALDLDLETTSYVSSEAEVFSTEALLPHNGARIEAIHIHGLKRSSERAVRWLLRVKVGDYFSAEQWMEGIKKLYNTTALYEIHTEIHERMRGPQPTVAIDLYLKDKWTILPYASANGGGGSESWGGGVFDSNITGYFTSAYAGISYLDGTPAYELGLNQEWVMDTDLMLGIVVTKAGFPVTVQNEAGNKSGELTWFRTQEQLLVGYHTGETFRLFSYAEIFQDSLRSAAPRTQGLIYEPTQYRLRPTVIFGRSNYTNYLESGHEFKIAPTSANFFAGNLAYHQLVLSYKRTMIWSGDSNFAYFLGGGIMSPSPTPYQFHLGGLDTVRGFSAYRYFGDRYLNGKVEFRPKLTSFRIPLFDIDRIVLQGCVFIDSGLISGASGTVRGTPRSSLGLVSAGLGLRGIAEKFSDAIARLDFGHTVHPREGFDLSFGVGQAF